MYSMMLTER